MLETTDNVNICLLAKLHSEQSQTLKLVSQKGGTETDSQPRVGDEAIRMIDASFEWEVRLELKPQIPNYILASILPPSVPIYFKVQYYRCPLPWVHDIPHLFYTLTAKKVPVSI